METTPLAGINSKFLPNKILNISASPTNQASFQTLYILTTNFLLSVGDDYAPFVSLLVFPLLCIARALDLPWL